MLNSIYIILLLSLAETSFFKQDKCAEFRTGSYIYEDNLYSNIIVKRTLFNQVEIIGDSIMALFSVEWKGSCKFILIPENVYTANGKNDLPNDTILVEIKEILSDSSYRYRAILKGDTVYQTMIKM
jgi:hypothetical protein